jgi:hypothetical protein
MVSFLIEVGKEEVVSLVSSIQRNFGIIERLLLFGCFLVALDSVVEAGCCCCGGCGELLMSLEDEEDEEEDDEDKALLTSLFR